MTDTSSRFRLTEGWTPDLAVARIDVLLEILVEELENQGELPLRVDYIVQPVHAKWF